jgi:HD-like signal output (HDOD) protein
MATVKLWGLSCLLREYVVSTEYDLSNDELQQTLASIEIPACPAVVMQVMAEAQKDAPDINVLSKIIVGDVGMSAFAIKLANSSLFRRGDATSSVPKAISRLGTRNIVCIVVAVALRNTMSSDIPAVVLDRFWNRAAAVAQAASLLARKIRGITTDMAYTYALFHNAAMPVMMLRFKDYYSTLKEVETNGLSLVNVEDERYRCSHAVVGAMLARNWGLSSLIGSAIRFHHDPEVYDPGKPFLDDQALGLIAVTHVAERIVLELAGETDTEVGAFYPQATAYLGLSEDDIHDFRDLLVQSG